MVDKLISYISIFGNNGLLVSKSIEKQTLSISTAYFYKVYNV